MLFQYYWADIADSALQMSSGQEIKRLQLLVPINTVRCLRAVYGATKPVNVLVNIVNPPPIDRV